VLYKYLESDQMRQIYASNDTNNMISLITVNGKVPYHIHECKWNNHLPSWGLEPTGKYTT